MSSDDLFKAGVKYHLRSLSFNDCLHLINEILQNKKYNDGTSVCFQMFYNTVADSIFENDLSGDYSNLKLILTQIDRLRDAKKFDCFKFSKHVLDEFLVIPMEIIWWLLVNKLLYLAHYCYRKQPVDISHQLFRLQSTTNSNDAFPNEQIVADILMALIMGCYTPTLDLSHLPYHSVWTENCGTMLQEFIEMNLNAMLSKSTPISFYYLEYLNTSPKSLPKDLIKRFYLSIIMKLMTYNVDEYDILSAYTYQELWSSAKIPSDLYTLYREIFVTCDFNDVVRIMEDWKYKVNWKYTLMAISMCMICKTPFAQLNAIACNFLDDTFQGGKFYEFVRCLLLIRQACFEGDSRMDYSTWYRTKFGIDSNYRTTTNQSVFKYLLDCLTMLIPYEPSYFLKIHNDRALKVPPNFNNRLHDYKTLCKIRLEELQESPQISLDKTEIIVLHIIEDCHRNNKISSILKYIFKDHYPIFFDVIIPQLRKDEKRFENVREMLTTMNYVKEGTFKTFHDFLMS